MLHSHIDLTFAVSSPVLAIGMPGGFELLIVLAILSAAAVVVGGRSGGGPILILTRFEASRAPADGCYVLVAGRPQGVFALLLRLFGLPQESMLKVMADRVSFEGARLTGKLFALVPSHQVACTHGTFARQPAYLIMSVLCLLGGLIAGAQEGGLIIVGVVFAGLFLLAFVLSRTMGITVQPSGGVSLGLRFKRGMIEGAHVDFAKVEECIGIMNYLICYSRTGQPS